LILLTFFGCVIEVIEVIGIFHSSECDPIAPPPLAGQPPSQREPVLADALVAVENREDFADIAWDGPTHRRGGPCEDRGGGGADGVVLGGDVHWGLALGDARILPWSRDFA
jgi:hypothetical protein